MSEWISVCDRMPEEHETVIVSCDDSIVTAAYQRHNKTNGYWYGKCCCLHEVENPYDVTHWMPIPDPPSKDKKVLDAEFGSNHSLDKLKS